MATRHAVVDGSNLATEGRTEPSLRQLDEAVRAFADEFHFKPITVIVDASFEHRVSTSERKAARAAIDRGDIITPPAGVIGRGDAFILQVADKADAVVLSNDSFQEFHGTYRWLFTEGRLFGGKPVPGVGWIFVARSPVRGPVSRRSTAGAKTSAAAPRKTAAKARKTTATSRATKKATKKAAALRAPKAAAKAPKKAQKKARKTESRSPAAGPHDGSNPLAGWRKFRRAHPVGSSFAATVDRFSSHGAYATAEGVSIYLPNRLLGDPAPSRARDVLDVGETRSFLVHRYDTERNGIDAGLVPPPGSETAKTTTVKKKQAAKKTTTKKTTTKKTSTTRRAAKKTTAKKTSTTRGAAKKAATKKTTRTSRRRR